jgi:hypothetical protein
MRVLALAATVLGLSLAARAETPIIIGAALNCRKPAPPQPSAAVKPAGVMHYRGLEKLLRRFADEAKRGKVIYAEARTRG